MLKATLISILAIGYSTTFEDLRNSQCTTCQVKDDKSAYWIPQLVRRALHINSHTEMESFFQYYQHGNGSFQACTHGGMIV
jgi:hypothetical protein